MTDLEMTRLCAEAMGWIHLGAIGYVPQDGESYEDIEKACDGKSWCKSGGNDWWRDPQGMQICGPCSGIPDPLHDDALAMALVKKFGLEILKFKILWQVSGMWGDGHGEWSWKRISGEPYENLNRAIVECVAKMQMAATEKRKA